MHPVERVEILSYTHEKTLHTSCYVHMIHRHTQVLPDIALQRRSTVINTLTVKIFERFNFRTNLYRPKILVSENCGDIHKAFNVLIEYVKMYTSENLTSEILPPESFGN